MSAALWSLVLVACPGASGGEMAYVSDGPIVHEAPVTADEGAPAGEYARWGLWRTYWGPEPQTCYAPRFGCYPGNNRHMHRYPAFHGYYYRRPYNYRMVFDYPWHAGLHEPTSHFSYNVHEPAGEELAPGPAQPQPPLPPAEAGASRGRAPRGSAALHSRPAAQRRPAAVRPVSTR